MSENNVSIYVASRFPDQALAEGLAIQLRQHGFVVTSRWLKEEPALESAISDFQRSQLAHMDVRDIKRANCLVLLNPDDKHKVGTGGCHYETAIARMKGKPVFILGKRSNVFHYLPGVMAFDTVEALVTGIHKEFDPA